MTNARELTQQQMMLLHLESTVDTLFPFGGITVYPKEDRIEVKLNTRGFTSGIKRNGATLADLLRLCVYIQRTYESKYPDTEATGNFNGPLSADIMECLWNRERFDVKAIVDGGYEESETAKNKEEL